MVKRGNEYCHKREKSNVCASLVKLGDHAPRKQKQGATDWAKKQKRTSAHKTRDCPGRHRKTGCSGVPNLFPLRGGTLWSLLLRGLPFPLVGGTTHSWPFLAHSFPRSLHPTRGLGSPLTRAGLLLPLTFAPNSLLSFGLLLLTNPVRGLSILAWDVGGSRNPQARA